MAQSKNSLIYLGAIDDKKWLNDGKNFSRNIRQGYRVYSCDGICNTICVRSGGIGRHAGLYLVKNNE